MQKNVTILGINGRIGIETAKAFLASGWQVRGMARTNKSQIKGVEFVIGDATSAADIASAIAPSEIVVNAVNLPYDKWENGAYEALTATIIEAFKGTEKTMLFPGNIYNYAAEQHLLTPQTPQNPTAPKGEIRVRVEQMLKAAAQNDGFQVLVLRSPDFYGPFASQTMFDLAMLTRIKSGIVQYPGPLELGHSWAYLPDLARAYVRLAEERAEFGRFETFHFRGHFKTGNEMVAAIQSALPAKTRVRQLSWSLLSAIGLFLPIVRAVVRMNYLWRVPHQLADPRLEKILGPDFNTPFVETVRTTTLSYLPGATTKPASERVLA